MADNFRKQTRTSERGFETISSPYNFVPLSEHIVFPGKDGDEKLKGIVTHDIPFRDSLDGELEITVTAETPIFVCDGKIQNSESTESKNFFQLEEDNYYIPATSIKGAVRNVMEIASFGKMQKISRRRYAIRDLNLPKYMNMFSDQKSWQPKVKAGWLDNSSDDWKIYPCKFAQVERKIICNYFRNLPTDFGNKRQEANKKYKTFLENTSNNFYCNAKLKTLENKKDKKQLQHTIVEEFCKEGGMEGYLVFTGQPQEFKEASQQKRREFFFYDEEDKPIWIDDPDSCERDDNGELIRRNQEDFIFIHTDEASSSSADWKNLQELKRHFNGLIPVFYLLNDDGSIRSFGLAMLFRLAAAKSIGEYARHTNEEHFPLKNEEFKADLAELIFGYTHGENALRGRVHFSHFKADPDVEPMEEVKRILGSPKPTYYPNYLVQGELKSKNDYKTFLDGDKDVKLRGWKRYPVLNKLADVQNYRTDGPLRVSPDSPMINRFRPLPVGTVFRGKLRYHNLRPIELGALIWSLTMGNSEYRRHSIGMAKPLGYGVIKIEVAGNDRDSFLRKCQKAFEEYMGERLKALEKNTDAEANKVFLESEQISSLIEMSDFVNRKTSWDFRYLFDGRQRLEKDFNKKYASSPRAYSDAKGNNQKKWAPLKLEEYTTIYAKPQQEAEKDPAPKPESEITKELNKISNPSKGSLLKTLNGLLRKSKTESDIDAIETFAISKNIKRNNKNDFQALDFYANVKKKRDALSKS